MIKVGLELQPCCSQKSGIGYYTYEIVKRLVNNNKYEFYGNIFNFMGRNNFELIDLDYDLVINKNIPYGIYRRIWKYISFEYEKLFHNNVDINHFFNYIVPPKVSGKVIDTIHDLGFVYCPQFLNKKNLARIKRDINYSIERSDIIVTVSNSVKNEIIKEFNIDSEKIKVVYNASTLGDDYLDKTYLQQVWNLYDNYFLYVGNIEPRKNLVNLIRAYSYLKKNENIPLKLVIVGQPMWNAKEVFKEVERLKLKNDIIFTGYVNEIEKKTLYKFCNTFVFPAIYEGFGIPIIDAMFEGKPVVCSDINVFREITNGNAYFANTTDAQDLASKMHQAMSSKDDAEIRKKVANNFSWDKSVNEIMGIYDLLSK